MIFSTMIPVKRNDNSIVTEGEQEDIFRIFWQRFGGGTVDAVADGYWIDPVTGKLFIDKVRRLTIAVPEPKKWRLLEIRRMVRNVGQFLGQKVMYFEHDAGGKIEVEFLNITPGVDYSEDLFVNTDCDSYGAE